MSITITATPAPDRFAIDLVVTPSAAAVLVSLRRTDANGTRSVRLPQLADTFERLTITDHECALTGLIAYEVVAKIDGVEQFADVNVTLGPLAPFTWLIHPAVLPEDIAHVTFVNWDMRRTSKSVTNDVIGRPDPVVNRDVLGLRVGTLDLYAHNYDEVLSMQAAADRRETIMIRQNDFPGGDGYWEINEFAPSIKLDTAKPGEVRWLVRMSLTEVTTPTSTLFASQAWTYRTVAATIPTYRVLRNTFRTYRDLLIDGRSA